MKREWRVRAIPRLTSGAREWQSYLRPACGFALIELLVVIGLIAILAALLQPALSCGRSAADSAACKSNLHQLAIGLTLYADDFGAFPMFWPSNLESYVGAKWPAKNYAYKKPVERRSGVFVCPAYMRMGGAFDDFTGSYGYNQAGASHSGNHLVYLGLAGEWLKPYPTTPDNVRPIRQSLLRNPSDMIALGDAPLEVVSDFGPEYEGIGQLVGYLDLSYGLIWYPIWLEVHNRASGDRSAEPWASRCRAAMRQRHNGRWNLVLCDGHVENLKTRELYGRADNQLRRWNNDNLPHRELLP